MLLKKIINKLLSITIISKPTPNEDIVACDPKQSILFKDFYIRYLKSLDGLTRSRSYSNSVTLSIHIIEGLGHYRMSEINKTVIKEFIYGFTKKTYVKGKNPEPQYYSQSTINKVFHLLHGAIKEASDPDGERLLRTDFMANIKIPRTNRSKAPDIKALSDKEMTMLSKIVSKSRMINVWVHLMLYTGVRPSEALALKWNDIDYVNKTVSIVRTLSQEEYVDVDNFKCKRAKPKITNLKNEREGRINYQRRTLKVGNKILGILKEWEYLVKSNKKLMRLKRENGTEDYLFCGSKGQFWVYDDYKQVYERLLQKHNISVSEFNPYRFRHNCCTRLFRLNINVKAVQLIMGDNTPDMVMRVYANLDRDDVLKGSESYAESLDMALDVISKP